MTDTRPRLRVVPAPKPRCTLCGEPADWFVSDDRERVQICPSCVARAVLIMEQAGYHVVADEVLAGYGWTAPSDRGS